MRWELAREVLIEFELEILLKGCLLLLLVRKIIATYETLLVGFGIYFVLRGQPVTASKRSWKLGTLLAPQNQKMVMRGT